ncbi:hypothetical protein [Yokenella regensburgei]|uniref:hypothetical protein n=1 Tax=Yokenella regensburgei TaxID=158877 RepID=UPI002899DEA2|nr:hypothetical protein [Yokenella regensburgei]
MKINNNPTNHRLEYLAAHRGRVVNISGEELALIINELQQYRKAAMQQEPETNDRQTLRRLAVILAGNDSPGEIMALTVTAQSFVDRCNQLVAERNALLAGATRQTQRTTRTEE